MKCQNPMLDKITCSLFLKIRFEFRSSSTKPWCQFRTMSCSSQLLNQTHDFFSKIPIHDMGLYSLNTTISEFCKNGDLISARQLFDTMPQRDTISWNSMMAGYNQNDRPNQVLQLVSEMQYDGLYPNRTTISTALSACAKLGALNQGKQLHGFSIKSCFSANVFVGTALITMYSKCKVVDCLIRVFDGINHRSPAAWNALISGYSMNRRIEEARRLFDKMPHRNVISWTAMINGYIEIKQIRNAFELFGLMPEKNLVSWSLMISGFVHIGQCEKALVLFSEMLDLGVKPSKAIFSSVIGACSGLNYPQPGMKIHGFVIKVGLDLDEIVVASLVFMYSKCLPVEEARIEFEKMVTASVGTWNSMISGYVDKDLVDEARSLFEKMPQRDIVSWNLIINGYLRNKRIDNAMDLFMRMPEPNVETRTLLMSYFIRNSRLEDARKIFDDMPDKDLVAFTALISGYMGEGLVDDARDLFEKMPERNVVVYNVMISGLIRHGRIAEANKLFHESPERDSLTWRGMIVGYVNLGLNDDAFKLYHQMIQSNLNPDLSIITSLLSSCSSYSLLKQGEKLHAVIIKYGVETGLIVSNSLINMYGKCGDMLIAQTIFSRVPEHDLVTWNALIHGYAINGHSKKGIEMFEKMIKTAIKPDEVTFLSVLSICSHRGLIEEARNYFRSMRFNHGVIPKLAHYTCMVDLLCRMGLVEEAEKLICSMPFEPDSIIWTSLLAGCKLNYKVEIAERAANQLFSLNPRNHLPYLQLSSIYRSSGRWVDMENLREKIDKVGMKKQPGCSWIEVNR